MNHKAVICTSIDALFSKDALCTFCVLARNGVFRAILVKKNFTISYPSLPPVNSWAPRALRMKKITWAIWQPRGCSHSPWWAPRNSECEKHSPLAPDSWGVYERNNFSEPRLLHLHIHRAFLVAQLVKNLLAVQETLVQFLGQENLLEKGQDTHSSIPGLFWWLRW